MPVLLSRVLDINLIPGKSMLSSSSSVVSYSPTISKLRGKLSKSEFNSFDLSSHTFEEHTFILSSSPLLG